MISEKLAEKKTGLWWIWEWGALIDFNNIMMLVHGKQDKFIHPKSKKVHEGYTFMSFKKFLDDGCYINKGIMHGLHGVKLFYVRKAALLIPDMEVGVPNKILPYIFRNDKMTLFIAPCSMDLDKMEKLRKDKESSAW